MVVNCKYSINRRNTNTFSGGKKRENNTNNSDEMRPSILKANKRDQTEIFQLVNSSAIYLYSCLQTETD